MAKLSEVTGSQRIRLSQVQQPQQQPSLASQFGRAAGILGRDVIEGIGGTVGIITDPFALSYGAATDQPVATQRENAQRFADFLGLPRPETATERVVSDVQQALAGGGALGTAARVARPTSGAGQAVARAFYENPGLQAASMVGGAGAAGVAREGGASPTGQVVAGLAGSLSPAGAAVFSGTRDPLRRELLEFAQRENIPVTAGQATQNRPLKNLSAGMNESIPFTGAEAAAARQQEAFNKALSRTFGEELPDLSPQSMQAARRSFRDRYLDVFQGRPIIFDTRGVSSINRVIGDAGNELAGDNLEIIRKNAQRVIREFEQGSITPARYQDLRGELYAAAGPDRTGAFLKRIVSVLDDVAARSLPPGSMDKLRQVNRQYNNLKVTEKALELVAGSGNDVNPANVWNILKQRGLNRSTPEMRRLAQLGQQILKEQIANSGTTGRTVGLTSGGLLGLGAVQGVPPDTLALLAGSGAVTAGTARFLNSPIGGRMVGLGLIPNAPRANRLLELGAPYTVAATNAQEQ